MRRTLRAFATGICLIVFATWCVHTKKDGSGVRAQEPTSDAVELKEVTYAQLCDAVRAQRGKIVVVDVWGFF